MLKLVADNVTELPVGNLMDIAGMARRFADDLRPGIVAIPFAASWLFTTTTTRSPCSDGVRTRPTWS